MVWSRGNATAREEGTVTTLSNEDILAVAKAANTVRMSWLAQADFPAKPIVKESFRSAEQTLPDWTAGEPYELKVIRGVLAGISGGTDPRSGTFKAQAIQAAAQLHDYAVKLLAELVS
jgi:hypothetical protein